MNYDGILVCLRTSASCTFCEEPSRLLGDISVMPGTIEEAFALPDHAKEREVFEVESGAMHTIKGWQVASLPKGGFGSWMLDVYGIKQPSARYNCRLVRQGFP